MAGDLISQREFAELIGVSSRTIFNLRREGLDEYCEVKGNSVRVRIPEGVQWYVRFKEAAAAAREMPTSLEAAELELAQLKTEEKRLEVARKKAELVEVKVVRAWAGDMMARVASRLDALPLRIAQGIHGETLAERRKQAEALVADVREEIRLGPLGEDDEEAAAA